MTCSELLWANWSAYNPLPSACVANFRTLFLVPCVAHRERRESQRSRCTQVYTSSSSSRRAPGQFPAPGSAFPDPAVPGASVTNFAVPDLIVSRTVQEFCHFNSKRRNSLASPSSSLVSPHVASCKILSVYSKGSNSVSLATLIQDGSKCPLVNTGDISVKTKRAYPPNTALAFIIV